MAGPRIGLTDLERAKYTEDSTIEESTVRVSVENETDSPIPVEVTGQPIQVEIPDQPIDVNIVNTPIAVTLDEPIQVTLDEPIAVTLDEPIDVRVINSTTTEPIPVHIVDEPLDVNATIVGQPIAVDIINPVGDPVPVVITGQPLTTNTTIVGQPITTNTTVVNPIGSPVPVRIIDEPVDVVAVVSAIPYESYIHKLTFFLNASLSSDQLVNGSVTPVDFKVDFTKKSLVDHCDFTMLSRAATTLMDFGTITNGLTNGLQFIKKSAAAVETILFTIKRGIEWMHAAEGNVSLIQFKNAEEILSIAMQFSDPFVMNIGESLIIRIRDNLLTANSGVHYQRMTALYRELP